MAGDSQPLVGGETAAAVKSVRRRHGLAALALAAVTLAAYANSFQAGFALDNKTLLLEDPRIRVADGANFALILQHTYWWPYGESGLYRPVATLSYLFNYAILGNGGWAPGYHWVNLALHCGNVLLVYCLALLLTAEFWPAFFAGVLWAVHPVSTEAVTNIVGRPDLLAATAVLGGLLAYRKSTESKGWRRIAWLVSLAAATTLGVFSKESALALPLVIVLYELTWWKERRQYRGLLWGLLAMLPPLVAMWYQRAAVLAASRPAEFPFWDNPLMGDGFWTARLTAVKVMARYLELAVWPQRLSCDYSYSQIAMARGAPGDWVAWAVVGATAAVAICLARRQRAAFFFAMFAFVTFLPASNLLVRIGTIMAERLLYLPLVGIMACLVMAIWCAGARARRPWLAPLALSVIAVGFAARTWARNQDWHDDLTMATVSVRTSPRSFKTHYLQSRELYAADPRHAHLDGAIDEAEKSVAILDSVPDASNNPAPFRWAAECHLLRGDMRRGRVPDGGSAEYRRSLELLGRSVSIARVAREDPEVPVFRAMSKAYLRLGDAVKALDAASEAQRLEPLQAESYRQIAEALHAGGRSDEAAVHLVAGVLLTADRGLWDDLLGLYRGGLDAKGCATIAGPRGAALNPQCEMVRQQFCRASVETVRVALAAGRGDLASRVKSAATGQFGCAAGQ